MSCGKCNRRKKDNDEIERLRKKNGAYKNISAKNIIALENIKKQINKIKNVY